MTILPEVPTFSTELALKQSGFLIVNNTHKPLCFNVGLQG
jgi:hypothetical protein